MAATTNQWVKTMTPGSGPGSVYADRLAEEQFFRFGGPPALKLDVIRHVWLSFVSDNDLAVLFENGERRYALIIVLQDSSRLGWKECQAIADALKVVERGTRITNESFGQLFEHFRRKYGKCEGPRIEHSILLGYVYPVRGTLQKELPHIIKHTGIGFDEEGDVILRSRTFDGQEYSVCVELTTKQANQQLPSRKQTLYKLDCKVLCELLSLLETGDKVERISFLAYMAHLWEDYNLVSVKSYAGGQHLAATILATRVKNREAMPDVMRKALNYVQDQQDPEKKKKTDNPPSPATRPEPSDRPGRPAPGPPVRPVPVPPGLDCPYTDCTYSRRLKESGQAKVYAGRFKGQDVAIKVFMEDDAREVFKRELTMLLKMASHPNVVDVLDFHEFPQPALVMRLIDGEDLMDWLQKRGPMKSEAARRCGAAIADGLAFLHRNGVVHRDLKSQNILMDKNNAPIIIDLGLGGALESKNIPRGSMDMRSLAATLQASFVSHTASTILGTILWLPPEMITAQAWSTKTDVYSFGIMLWEMLSGRLPFVKPGEEPAMTALLVRIAGGERPDMSAVRHADPDLQELMKKCWDQDPKKRPTMKYALDVLQGNDPVAIFNAVDTDGDKQLSFSEFTSFLERYAPRQVPNSEMERVFAAIDVNHDSNISLAEFQEFWRGVEMFGLERALRNCRRKTLDNNSVREWLQS